MLITISKREVDPQTGSISKVRKVVNINPKDPYNSLEFHKIADLLDVDQYSRTNRALADKLAIIYNYVANDLKTNDPNRIANKIVSLKKQLGYNNLIGESLITKLFRHVRVEMNKMSDEERAEQSKAMDKAMKEMLRDDKAGAKDIRDKSVQTEAEYEESLKKATIEHKQMIRESVREKRKLIDTKDVKTTTIDHGTKKFRIDE